MKTFLNYLLENYADEIHKVIDFTKEPKSKQSKFDFMFSMDQVEERLEYALQTTYGMKVVYEFECYLDTAIDLKPVEVCNLHDIKKTDDDNITYEEYTKRVDKYYDNGHYDVNQLIRKSGLNYKEWFNTFDTLYDLVTTCKLKLNDDVYKIENDIIYEIVDPDYYSFIERMNCVGEDIKVRFNTNKVVIKDGKVNDKETDTWYIEKDGSLSSTREEHSGVEIVTPHIPLTEYLTSFNKTYSLLNKYVVITDESTGFHVNLVLKKPIDFIKLIIMTHDTKILAAVDRQTSRWCESQYKKLKGYCVNQSGITNLYDNLTDNDEGVILLSRLKVTSEILQLYFPENINPLLYDTINKVRGDLSFESFLNEFYNGDQLALFFYFINHNFNSDIVAFADNEEDNTVFLNPNYKYVSSINIVLLDKSKQSSDNDNSLIEKQIKQLHSFFKKEEFYFMNKYRSINFLKYKSGQMIEFRILGNDYLGEYIQETVEYIKYFIFMMVVASNEDLYKEEYHEKIKELFK